MGYIAETENKLENIQGEKNIKLIEHKRERVEGK